ncbi:hypothetical protein ACHAXR_003023 [Thalassiosira sp. AJA248-18]
MPHTPGLWKHVSRPISFTLVVDDFSVKYVGEQHWKHLIEAIKEDIKLAWDYNKRFFDISMTTYVGKQLVRYAPPPQCKQHTPYAPHPVVFGRAAQDLSPPPTKANRSTPRGRRECNKSSGASSIMAEQLT